MAAHAHGTRGVNAALQAGVDSIEHGTFLDETSLELFAKTGAFLIRGYAVSPQGLCAAENGQKFIFVGRGAQPKLPAELREVVGLTFDGTLFWVADGASNKLFGLKLEGQKTLSLERTLDHVGKRIVGVAWDGKRLWTCDEKALYALDEKGALLKRFELSLRAQPTRLW